MGLDIRVPSLSAGTGPDPQHLLSAPSPIKRGANPAPKPPTGVKPVPTARARGDKRTRAVPSTRHPPPVTTRLRGDRGCHRGTPNTSPCPAPPRLTYKTLPPAGPTCSCRWQWVPAAKRLPGRAGSSSHVPSRPVPTPPPPPPLLPAGTRPHRAGTLVPCPPHAGRDPGGTWHPVPRSPPQGKGRLGRKVGGRRCPPAPWHSRGPPDPIAGRGAGCAPRHPARRLLVTPQVAQHRRQDPAPNPQALRPGPLHAAPKNLGGRTLNSLRRQPQP